MSAITRFFCPGPSIERLPEDQVKKLYPHCCWSVLESTIVGYAAISVVLLGLMWNLKPKA